jgi:hypothetical protein
MRLFFLGGVSLSGSDLFVRRFTKLLLVPCYYMAVCVCVCVCVCVLFLFSLQVRAEKLTPGYTNPWSFCELGFGPFFSVMILHALPFSWAMIALLSTFDSYLNAVVVVAGIDSNYLHPAQSKFFPEQTAWVDHSSAR